MSAIITLTSDWGLLDHYVGAVKGTIIKRLPDARIVDITHLIPPFDLKKAAFIIRNTYHHFPEKTIHIIGINTEESESVPHIVVKYNGQYFIGADNGIFTMIFDELPEQIIELSIPQDTGFFTFSSRDRFVKTAIHLALGNDVEDLGIPRSELNTFINMKPQFNGNTLRARVIYVDNYENLFLNVTSKEFRDMGKGRSFSLFIKGKPENIGTVNTAYGEVPEGEIVFLFSTTGFIEIAVNKGNASSLLGLKPDDVVVIEFNA
ncbi:MAG: SAM-dependent chlorinase/fluorinase [Lentimicrobiaceae bacterium]